MKVTLLPILKNRTQIAADNESYQRIVISKCATKLLKSILQHRMKEFFCTSHAETGVKERQRTEVEFFTHNETIEAFLSQGSPVFTCFFYVQSILQAESLLALQSSSEKRCAYVPFKPTLVLVRKSGICFRVRKFHSWYPIKLVTALG